MERHVLLMIVREERSYFQMEHASYVRFSKQFKWIRKVALRQIVEKDKSCLMMVLVNIASNTPELKGMEKYVNRILVQIIRRY